MKQAHEILDLNSEVVVKLADGHLLKSGVYKPDCNESRLSGEYVRLCDPTGPEIYYWDFNEWKDEPILVMGAIINAAAGLRIRRK